MKEIDVAHKVASSPWLEGKLQALGEAALVNVINDPDLDYTTILAHLQFFRRLWVEGMSESARKVYLKRSGVGIKTKALDICTLV